MTSNNLIGTAFKYMLLKFPVLWKKQNDVDYYVGLREKMCLCMIALWKIRSEHRGYNDLYPIIKELKGYLRNKSSLEDKRILFVVEHVSPRLTKIAKALYDHGYHITLLYNIAAKDYNGNLKGIKKYCEGCRAYECLEQLIFWLIESRISILHFFDGWSDLTNLLCLVQVKGILPKIVFENYDVFNGMYIDEMVSKWRCRIEKYCMEHVDGVCCREYAMECLDFHLKNKSLVFLDYAETVDVIEKKHKEHEEELSLCYVGGITTEKEYPDSSYACLLEFAVKCEEHKCHFHVYPSTWDEDRFLCYIKYDRDSGYFHFHRPIEHNKLYQVLNEYDYGIFPSKIVDQSKDIDGYTTYNKEIYASTNKYFDYISAGIPMIGSTPVRLTEEFEKTGLMLRWTIENYDFDELRRRKKELRERVIQNRGEWMIENRIFDLINYYEQIVGEQK